MAEKRKIARKTLPDGYRIVKTVDIAKQTGLAIGLNIAGFVLFFLSYLVFFRIVRDMRGLTTLQIFKIEGGLDFLLLLAGAVFFFAALIFLHEAAHGVFFFLFTKEKPKFAMKVGYAYAAAPEWYIRRDAYLVVGAAPAVLMTTVGFIACLFVPMSWLAVIVLFISLNFSSSVGDYYVLLRLITKSEELYVKDEGDKMTFYEPVSKEQPPAEA